MGVYPPMNLVMHCLIFNRFGSVSELCYFIVPHFRKKTSFSTKPPSVAVMGTREPPQPGGLTGTPAASCLRKKSSSSLENQDSSATNRIPSAVKQMFCCDSWSCYSHSFIRFCNESSCNIIFLLLLLKWYKSFAVIYLN